MLSFKDAFTPPPTPRTPAERLRSEESVIGVGTSVRANVETGGRLLLSGELYGEVRVERLMIAGGAALEGVVEAGEVEIHGRLTGSLKARHVRLCASARVEADIVYETLIVEPGARLDGRCFPGLNSLKG